MLATAEGNGPVNALDRALRDALDGRFPALDRVHLTDYKVRVLDTEQGHRRDHPGAARQHRRRRDLDHDRREREHHRGQLAGPVGLDRLRLAPSRDPGVATSGADRPVRSRPARRGAAPGAELRAGRRTCRRRGSWRADRPGDLGAIQPQGRAPRHARPERRLRAHARQPGARPVPARAGRARRGRGRGRRRARDEAGRDVRPGARRSSTSTSRSSCSATAARRPRTCRRWRPGRRPRAPTTTTWCAAPSSTP